MAREEASDAVAVLTADHEAVDALFAQFEAASDPALQRSTARLLCRTLTAHAAAEEELFYPAALDALEDRHAIDCALSLHEGMRSLVQKIRSLPVTDDTLAALVARLKRLVAEHVKQEEQGLFPRLAFTSLDLEALGRQLGARRDDMLRRLGEAR